MSYEVYQISTGRTVEFNIVKVLYKYLCIKVLQNPVFPYLICPTKYVKSHQKWMIEILERILCIKVLRDPVFPSLICPTRKYKN